MKAAFLFLLHLCLLLLGGSGAAHAGTGSSTAHTSRLLQATAPAVIVSGEAFLRGTPHAGEEWSKAEFGIDEEESEDESGPRMLLLARCLLAFSFAFLLQRPPGSSPRVHSPFPHFSFLGTDRYLALGVLRL